MRGQIISQSKQLTGCLATGSESLLWGYQTGCPQAHSSPCLQGLEGTENRLHLPSVPKLLLSPSRAGFNIIPPWVRASLFLVGSSASPDRWQTFTSKMFWSSHIPICSGFRQIWQGHPLPERLTDDNGLLKHHDSYTMDTSQIS